MEDEVHHAVAVAPHPAPIPRSRRRRAAEREPHGQRHGQPLELVLRRIEQVQELRASTPHSAPSTTNSSTSGPVTAGNTGISRRPVANSRITMFATTDETIIGPRLSMAMPPSTISTKKAPAIGALYADVMPAAAQATSRRRRGGSKCRSADQRRGERRELHHRASADRAAAADRQQRRHAAPQALADRHDAVAERDRFHVVGLGGLLGAAGREQQHAAGEAARGRHPEPHVPRQALGHLHEAAALPGDQVLHQVDAFAERHRGKAPPTPTMADQISIVWASDRRNSVWARVRSFSRNEHG